jgi:hypothetical protein
MPPSEHRRDQVLKVACPPTHFHLTHLTSGTRDQIHETDETLIL